MSWTPSPVAGSGELWEPPRVASVRGVLPKNRYEQATLTDALIDWTLLGEERRRLLRQFHANSAVRSRHLALPLEEYPKLTGLGQANDAYLAAALELVEEAVTGALDEASLKAADIDFVVCASTTGIATPSLDARLADRLGFRPEVKRMPLHGLGCVAGAAGLARLHDYLLHRPDQVALLVAVELCSLTLQLSDDSLPALIGSALFGDGAAAVVMTGADRCCAAGRGSRILATRSRLYPGTERLMGWDVTDSGFNIVLGHGIPAVIERYLAEDVDRFLADHHLSRRDIDRWVCHPGGPKVLRTIEDRLELPSAATDLTWRSLSEIGNVSSASVLHVLRDTNRQEPPPGTLGLLMAVGPGFCAEFVLVRW
ncbi:type III polyketide synthase [Streptantibioticus rubrisoli]|uniref:Type III polyketide synthase n=1 Tax=Streptantibioticus rubrisoli TaxID=1387313 RepID=A0ABT1PIZ8_9ACTN|nr:3-oxoacyl-[acyl-carrier-protein] synthase III C-terminal domain-containing protein [Streptantibioticus rubrisoli]MCQ4045335.1 type III polyketide synthase [Streptantibioticus rubrisoli]